MANDCHEANRVGAEFPQVFPEGNSHLVGLARSTQHNPFGPTLTSACFRTDSTYAEAIVREVQTVVREWRDLRESAGGGSGQAAQAFCEVDHP